MGAWRKQRGGEGEVKKGEGKVGGKGGDGRDRGIPVLHFPHLEP